MLLVFVLEIGFDLGNRLLYGYDRLVFDGIIWFYGDLWRMLLFLLELGGLNILICWVVFWLEYWVYVVGIVVVIFL